MKHKKLVFTIIIFIIGMGLFHSYTKMEKSFAVESLSKSAIRFHVLANSDTDTDQALKMKVKETVVDYIYNNTVSFKTVEETKAFITQNDGKIKKLASETIHSFGYDYSVTSSFGMQDFPDKTYGDIVFPKGEYTSYTLSIGEGKGHNWWCVLYPPLCFVDASTGVVPDSSKEMLKESLTGQEYNTIVKYRFKYFTFLNKFLD
jgi:stage II sporulation protein R